MTTLPAQDLGRSPLIDVHGHYLTESFVAASKAAGRLRPDGMPGWPAFSVSKQLEMMDSHGIERSIMSISPPGVHFGSDESARKLARDVNDFGAQLVADHPDRFGLFAALPLPDVDGAVTEAVRALDDLGVDGITVETNAGGRYLSDPAMEPLLDELDRRGTVLFIHPSSPACLPTLTSDPPRPMLEFLFDSTRNVADLILSGTLQRHPNLHVIIPHGGGVLPLVAERIEQFRTLLGHKPGDGPSVRELLATLWYDMAGAPFPLHIPTLAQVVGLDHVLYGSDAPWTPEVVVAQQVRSIDQAPAADGQPDWRTLTTANAKRLLSATPDRVGLGD